MAQINKKRKFETHIWTGGETNSNADGQQQQVVPICPAPGKEWTQTSHRFHSSIASFTRPEKTSRDVDPELLAELLGVPVTVEQHHQHQHQQQQQHQQASLVLQAQQASRVSDGIVLNAAPNSITVTYNDVVCSKGKTTSSLVGNQRYKVWVNLHKEAFRKATDQVDRRMIACSIVNAINSSVPAGRFLSLDIHTGYWYDVGYDRAVGMTLETLMTETGLMKAAHHPTPATKKKIVKRTYASKAA